MIEITAKGLIEVRRDGVLISSHRAEREALESCARSGAGRYILTYPDVWIDVMGEDVTLETGEINGQVTV
jgi:hypothetical protein